MDRHRSRPAPRTPAGAQSTSVPFTLAGANLLLLLLRSLARLLATSPASAPACAVACPTASYLVICPTSSYLTRFCCSSGSRSLPRSPAHVPHQKSAYTSKGSAKEPEKPLIRFADRTPILFCNFLASTGGVSRGQKVQDEKHTQHFYHAQRVCGALLVDGPLPPVSLSSHIAHLLRIWPDETQGCRQKVQDKQAQATPVS